MSWDAYIGNLLCPDVQDAAICSINPPSVWAAKPGGVLANITAAEINALAAEDCSNFFINGLTLGGVRCGIIRDNINDSYTLDVRTKTAEGPTYTITAAKTCKAFVIAMGAEGVHGGVVNAKAHAMCKYLRDQNY